MAEVPRKVIRLVTIGKTGNGKSSSCNTIVGEQIFPSGCDSAGVTTNCLMRYAERFGKLICLVDTPGLQDISRDNEDVQKEIKRCIDFTTPGPHAVILVVQLTRFTEEDVKTLKHFCSYFGENVAQYVIVLFTRFDDMKRMKGFIENLTPPLKDFLRKCGNRYVEFDNTLEGGSAESQVQRLLDIVDNMVRENGGLHYTNEDYEKADKELQRKALEIKKKNDQERIENEEKIKKEIKKQYELEQQQLEQELQRAREREREREKKNLFEKGCDIGRKIFGW
ncbi:Hypothetical predicted protein [Mytilus galloprovincialis]|uniref:AIG1-type G domain-containing protein n=1 Tax=Mytilus galloprovincialis TaxID=29158 RepID=A0A8B6C279_MYTGA|nr:Hypothetical predicted protein [Mytilus galloprovincialis]